MRVKKWEKSFRDWLAANSKTPFRWGRFDCVLMAGLCSDAITGNQYAKDFIGRYKTRIGAMRIVKTEFGSFDNIFSSRYREINPNMAWRGDVVLAEIEGEQTYGVLESNAAYFAGRDGLIFIQKPKILKAWRIE